MGINLRKIMRCACVFLAIWGFLLIFTGCEYIKQQNEDYNKRVGEEEQLLPQVREAWFSAGKGNPVNKSSEISADILTTPSAEDNGGSSVQLPKIEKQPEQIESISASSAISGIEFFTDEPVKADFNFSNAGLASVVSYFAQQLNFSYIVEGAISGTATLSMHEELTKKELWTIFCNLLRISNMTATYDGKVLRLRSNSQVATDLTLDNLGTDVELTVFHLQNIKPENAIAHLKTLASRELRFVQIANSNTLILLDRASVMPQIKWIIQELDKPVADSRWRDFYVCKHISSSQVASELKKILPILGFSVSGTSSAQDSPGLITLDSMDRLNLVVSSAASPAAIQEIRKWCATLDQEDSDREQIYVYQIINGRADMLKSALSTMFTVTGSMVDKDSTGKVTETQNIGTPGTITANSTVVPGSVFDVPVRVWVDNTNSRFAIRTRPRTYAVLKAYLERLDTIPSQVLIRAFIVEITLTDSTNFGMEFMMQNTIDNWESSSGTDWKYLTPGSGQGQQYGGKIWLYDPNDPERKFGYINALAGQNNVKIIARPVMQLESNEEGTINVGDQVPIITTDVTNTSSASLTGTTLVRSVTYKNTGTILKVTPRISRGGRIQLNVDATVSEAQTNKTSNIDSPQVQTRDVHTSLSMRDGQTVFCGGMIREKIDDNLDSLPLINNIPILRRLLGNTNSTAVRSELVVLITANIITEETDLEQTVRGFDHSMNSIMEFDQPDRSRQRFTPSGDLTKCFWK